MSDDRSDDPIADFDRQLEEERFLDGPGCGEIIFSAIANWWIEILVFVVLIAFGLFSLFKSI